MHRTFVTTTRRQQTFLDGLWDFCPDPQDRGVSEGWYAHFPERSQRLWVPGVWNTTPSLLSYEGPAWYRTRFILGPCEVAVLTFGSVTHQANVWLDGEPLGEHYGGFLPFSFTLSAPQAGEHELVVRVDNTHDRMTTIPSDNLDWCRYGGITRPVWVETLNQPAYIASMRLMPFVENRKPMLRVRAELVNMGEKGCQGEWHFFVDGARVRSDYLALRPLGSDVLSFTVELPGAALWSPSQPNLHTARLEFLGDDLIERTGFREIRIVGKGILLNGEPIRLRGINRHEDHPDWGFALPVHLMLNDLALLQDLGVNAIRGAHYPNDPRMLDLCDEMGFLFMEEIPLWGFTQDQFRSDLLSDRATAMLWAMIERDIHHPCIWAWSLLNECATDTPEGRMVVEQLVQTARELDPTRPLTFASDRGKADQCFDLVDIASVNAYYGWYRRDGGWVEFLDEMRTHIGEKPLLITEFGAGAIYGCHSLNEGAMWSEEYQAQILMEALDAFERREDLAGYYIWQFCDTRTDRTRALHRPRNYNNKGLLNEHRLPKLAYYAVRKRLRA